MALCVSSFLPFHPLGFRLFAFVAVCRLPFANRYVVHCLVTLHGYMTHYVAVTLSADARCRYHFPLLGVVLDGVRGGNVTITPLSFLGPLAPRGGV
jgi:hypothetical protein